MQELPAPFGKYYLTEQLAVGGMAAIYLATLRGPLGFEKLVVIKQIHPRLSGQQAFVDLFAAEAKTLVSLTHGNIVPVYELGMVDDTYFIAMEYVDGPTLFQFADGLTAAGRRLEPAVAAFIVSEILAGLDHAHRRDAGVVHRDLSPRNVMLSRAGDVKIVDFGIAVTLGSSDASGSATADDKGSEPTGSFAYMSPEQVRREPLTTQSDLFSAGVLLWELLTGTPLFSRATAAATLAAVTDDTAGSPSEFAGDAVVPLDLIVARALARSLDDRWATADEFRSALNRFLYAQETVPSSRDLARLVATICPPVRRRRASSVAEPRPPRAPSVAEGPTTAVMSVGSPQPRGKPVRAKTFATNIALEAELAQPAQLAVDEAAASLTLNLPLPPARSRRGVIVAVVLSLVVIAAAAIAWSVTRTPEAASRSAILIVDAAPSTPIDATHLTVLPAPADASRVVDATMPVDARRQPVIPADARPRLVVDARTRTSVDAAAAAATSPGRIKIGAAPWGNYAIDGSKKGATPAAISVTPGAHDVVVTCPPNSKKERQVFRVSVEAGEEISVFAECGEKTDAD